MCSSRPRNQADQRTAAHMTHTRRLPLTRLYLANAAFAGGWNCRNPGCDPDRRRSRPAKLTSESWLTRSRPSIVRCCSCKVRAEAERPSPAAGWPSTSSTVGSDGRLPTEPASVWSTRTRSDWAIDPCTRSVPQSNPLRPSKSLRCNSGCGEALRQLSPRHHQAVMMRLSGETSGVDRDRLGSVAGRPICGSATPRSNGSLTAITADRRSDCRTTSRAHACRARPAWPLAVDKRPGPAAVRGERRADAPLRRQQHRLA